MPVCPRCNMPYDAAVGCPRDGHGRPPSSLRVERHGVPGKTVVRRSAPAEPVVLNSAGLWQAGLAEPDEVPCNWGLVNYSDHLGWYVVFTPEIRRGGVALDGVGITASGQPQPIRSGSTLRIGAVSLVLTLSPGGSDGDALHKTRG